MKQIVVVIQIIGFVFLLQKNITAQQQNKLVIDSSFTSGNIGIFSYHRTGDDFKIFQQDDSAWRPLGADKILLAPYTTHWLYFSIYNNSNHDRTLKYFINNVQAGNSRMYVVSDGMIDSSGQTGSLLQMEQRANSDRFLSIPFKIKAAKKADVYIKTFRRQTGITFTPVIEDASVVSIHREMDYFMVFALSLLIIVFFVAVYILIAYPSKAANWFAAYVGLTFLYTAAASGYGSLYLWGSYPAFEENAAIFLGAACVTCMFELCRNVFDMKQHYRRLNAFLVFYSVTNVFLILSGILLLVYNITVSAYSVTMAILYLLEIAGYIAILYVSVVEVFIKKKKEFVWFILLISFILSLILVIILLEVGKLEFNYRVHSFILSVGPVPQAIVPLIFLINRILSALKRKQQEIMEAKFIGEQNLLKERLRFSQQLHDDIGSTLSGVSMYSYMANNLMEQGQHQKASESLQVIQRSANEMVDKLNDLVWSVNPNEGSFQQILDRLQQYGREMCEAKNIVFRLQLNESLLQHTLTEEQRFELYLILKEAINNAVKYSEASLLQVAVSEYNGALEIVISDNGKGFDLENIKKGNGLINMQKRADELAAHFTVESKQDKGCIITLKIKIT